MITNTSLKEKKHKHIMAGIVMLLGITTVSERCKLKSFTFYLEGKIGILLGFLWIILRKIMLDYYI